MRRYQLLLGSLQRLSNRQPVHYKTFLEHLGLSNYMIFVGTLLLTMHKTLQLVSV